MELHLIAIEKPEPVNLILGQAHFIKTVEDIHEAVVATAPQMKFGLAFCEASGPALVRWSGTFGLDSAVWCVPAGARVKARRGTGQRAVRE